jgi:glycosyltransferase involved in cell wall biosynthesis
MGNKNITNQLELGVAVTVGLCVKNAEKTIRNCIMSVAGQNYPKNLVTVILVDGNSKDKTVEIAKMQLLSSGLLLKFFSDNGQGLGVARQTVLENSNAKYIIWVDGDTTISKQFLDEQVKLMEKNPNVCVATGTFVRLKNPNESLPAALESIEKYVGSNTFNSEKSAHGLPPNDTSVYRVEALKQVGGFDTNIRGASEDEDVINRMRGMGWAVTVNGRAKYYAFPKATWQGMWKEQSWFGHGQHYLGHKNEAYHFQIHHIPFIRFLVGFREGSKAYRLTSEKKVFLLPFAGVFFTMAWWYGYLQAHLGGYGHNEAK